MVWHGLNSWRDLLNLNLQTVDVFIILPHLNKTTDDGRENLSYPRNDEADRLSREGTIITIYEKAYIPYSYIKKTINKKVHTDS